LGVEPRWSLSEGVRRTMHWYRQQHEGADARTLCESDMSGYEAAHKSDRAA
jgi:CDP-glucose 4,6-dehydratase